MLWMVKVGLPAWAVGGPVIYSETSMSVSFFFHLMNISAGENPETSQASQATAWDVGCMNCLGDRMTKLKDGALTWLESIWKGMKTEMLTRLIFN